MPRRNPPRKSSPQPDAAGAKPDRRGGGAANVRGVIVQTLYALLTVLKPENTVEWLELEPALGDEKFDLLWKDADGLHAAQVKSSINLFSFATADRLAKELHEKRRECGPLASCRLILVGHPDAKLNETPNLRGVSIDWATSDENGMLEQAAHRLHGFMDQVQPGVIKAWGLREIAESWLSKFEFNAVQRLRMPKADLVAKLSRWVSDSPYYSQLPQQGGSRRVWHPPLRAVPYFGRADAIEEALALWREHRCLAITGTGGSGKTGLAAEILARLEPDAERPGASLLLHDYYEQPAHRDALASLITKSGKNPKDYREEDWPHEVRSILGANGTLLYLEGCEKAEDVRALLDLAVSARVLLTTRDDTAPRGTHGWPLPPLSVEAGAQIIRYNVTSIVEDATVSRSADEPEVILASFLGAHCLACHQAGHVLKEEGIGARALLAGLKKAGLGRLTGEEREHRSTSFLLQRNLQHALDDHPDAASLWYILSLGALAPMPLEILTASMQLKKDDLVGCIRAMRHLGLTRMVPMPAAPPDDVSPGWLLAHALLKTYGESNLPGAFKAIAPDQPAFPEANLYARWREAWVDFLTACSRKGHVPGGAPRYEALLPHWSAFLDAIDKRESEDAYIRTVAWTVVAGTYRAHGRYSSAEHLLRRDTEWCEKHRGPEHPDTLTSLSNLGVLLYSKGDLAGAEPLCRRALETQERVLGPEHPETLRSLANLGILLSEKGDLAGAEPLFRRARETMEHVLGPEHPATLTSLANLGALLRAKGDLARAEPLCRRALETQERVLGPKHPDTLFSLNNLGSLLYSKCDLAGAEPLYRRALETQERVLGAEHPDTLFGLNNLGILLSDKGDLAGAEGMMRRAVAGYEKLFSPEHPDRQRAERNLANIIAKRKAEGK